MLHSTKLRRIASATLVATFATVCVSITSAYTYEVDAVAQSSATVPAEESESSESGSVTAGVSTALGDMIQSVELPEDLKIVPSLTNPVEAVAEEPTLEEIYADIEVKEVSKTRYTTTVLNIREYPTTEAEILGKFDEGDKVKVIGKIAESDFVQVSYKDGVGYVAKKYLSKDKPTPSVAEYSWSGEKLNRRNGTVTGPSGKETYYNLPMGGVISIMRGIGNNDEYWVRDDGVKMLGQYVMVAADLSIRPRGSHVPTSLGMGVVCDTGSFIYSNPYQLDIAVAW